MFSNKYELVVVHFRNSINLITEAKRIKRAVKSVVPNAIVRVYQNYFEIITNFELNHGERTKIGKAIAAYSNVLNNCKRKHSNGYHLFKRKK